MSREMQSLRIAVSQHITENVSYSDMRINRRSSLFDARSQTNNSQRERSIYINTEEDLVFWMKNVLDKLLEMIKMIKEENRNLIKNYNE
jgi:mevalonate pyrophosphate decarboxylase